MYKFINLTTKKDFMEDVEWSGLKIKPENPHSNVKNSGKFPTGLGMYGAFALMGM